MELLALELNKKLETKAVYRLLSETGRRMFFPKGIVSQSAEAGIKAKRYNATVGMATTGKQPMFLPSVMKYFKDLEPEEIFSYAPTAGIPLLRDLWKREMLKKNPSLAGKNISHPVVTAGLTHGISLAADLFVDKNDEVLTADMYWGNYKLIVEGRREGFIKSYPFFDKSCTSLDVDALEKAVRSCSSKKAVVMLNFPNNPAGYSPSFKEVESLKTLFYNLAEEGYTIAVICDDAYFGLFFEDNIYKESVFTELCDLHENILAVKIDGATKEELVWGFRIGFITYGCRGFEQQHYDALQQKTMGAIRSSVSSCSNISQNLLIKGLTSGSYQKEKDEIAQIMKNRYNIVKNIVSDIPAGTPLMPLPFNSGYFMTFKAENLDTEKLRLYLLDKYETGTISIAGKYLRVAFSSVDAEDIPELYKIIFNAAGEC